ncbi:COX15/CtaA family protein [Aeromicrobium sp.]|uniref:COX15/CtaA family protein n=1 Tax=Aeromicrobium sp. TaxID=1871063 RepID=UPI003D6B48FB
MGVKSALLSPDRVTVERWAWASVVANTVIVLTGGLVRLTGSGLGCPSWPRCTDESFVPHRELGIHGVIEFGNRMLTYALVAVAIGTLIAIWRWAGATPFTRRLAVVLALGIPFQGVIGGITVLTDLNPWIVSLHLLLSMALIVGSVLLVVRVRPEAATPVPARSVALSQVTFAVLVVVVYLGTMVTGSGPHAGDASSPRNGLDPHVMSHVHAAGVYVLLALTLATIVVLRGTAAVRFAFLLLAVELLQVTIGLVQYLTDLPVALVAAHLVGAAILVASGARLVLAVRSAAKVDERPLATQSGDSASTQLR